MSGRTCLWSPHGNSKFMIGSSNELRMMEWENTKSSSTLKTLSVISELGQAKSFAWSASLTTPDLISIGLTNGKCILIRAEAYSTLPSNGVSEKNNSSVQISPRHSRPCNIVCMSVDQPYLAIGLEKGRGESLLLYDIESHSRSLTGPSNLISRVNSSSTTRPNASIRQQDQNYSPSSTPILSSPPSGFSTEPKPLMQFGSSESVTAAAFLTPSLSSSPLLSAGMGGKFLRIYDLRSNSTSIAIQWSTRSLSSIKPNPFNHYQLSSYGEDGIIKLWDLRMNNDSLLSFSETDAGSIPSKNRSMVNKPLVDMVFSPTKRGVLATLQKDSDIIRVWQLCDGSEVKSSEGMRLPVLLSDQRTRAFQHPLSSFAFANSTNSSPASLNLLGVSRDSKLEIIELTSPQHCTFLERSLVLPTGNDFTTIKIKPAPIPSLNNNTEEELDGGNNRAISRRDSRISAESNSGGNNVGNINRGRSLSLSSVYVPSGSNLKGEEEERRRRNETPRPSGSINTRRISQDRNVNDNEEDQDDQDRVVEPLAMNSVGYGGLSALARDPSIVLREWVDRGYGSNPVLNASLVDSTLKEFWNWIARAELLTPDGCLLDYDFRYKGVLPILQGFSNSATTTTTQTSGSNSTSTNKLKDAAYSAVALELVSRRKLEGTFHISSSQYSAQRKLALQICGTEFEESFETVCLRYQRAEDFESAARFSFLNGNLESTIKYLRSCKESLRLITPILAAYISQKDSLKSQGTDGTFSKLCGALSSDVETPWIRSLFAFMASGDWRDVVDESGLPLKDRVAVALRFLSDHELIPFLQSLGKESLATGDLEAILLYGFNSQGIKLLQSYLDRTADIQTIALATSFISPGLGFGISNSSTSSGNGGSGERERIERWIQTYRILLNKLKLYTSRALFDSARGRRSRILLEQTRLTGETRNLEVDLITQQIKDLTPPQILIRCQFCSSNLSIPNGLISTSSGSSVTTGVKVVACPNCHKKLPGCSICLGKKSIDLSNGGNLNQSQVYCQKCRHGGHCDCYLSWFGRSDGEVCPVSDCDCKCTEDM